MSAASALIWSAVGLSALLALGIIAIEALARVQMRRLIRELEMTLAERLDEELGPHRSEASRRERAAREVC